MFTNQTNRNTFVFYNRTGPRAKRFSFQKFKSKICAGQTDGRHGDRDIQPTWSSEQSLKRKQNRKRVDSNNKRTALGRAAFPTYPEDQLRSHMIVPNSGRFILATSLPNTSLLGFLRFERDNYKGLVGNDIMVLLAISYVLQ